jgi:predicted RNase H-like HicB family nuclease
MNNNLRMTAERLSARPYNVRISLDQTTDGKPVYLAQSPELEGCFGQGYDIDDAVHNLHEARIDYILSLLEDDLPIPEPAMTATSTNVNLTSTITLRYHQSDARNVSDLVEGIDSKNKPLRLYEGAIRAE